MSIRGLRGRISTTDTETKDITVTEDSGKVALDVNVVSGVTGGGGGGDASAANQSTLITETQSTNTKLDTLIANQSTASSDSTEAKQDVQISEIQSSNTKLDELIAQKDIPAHTHIRYTYVSSGNGAGQIETIRYYSGTTAAEVLEQTRTFTYNANDEIELMEKS